MRLDSNYFRNSIDLNFKIIQLLGIIDIILEQVVIFVQFVDVNQV